MAASLLEKINLYQKTNYIHLKEKQLQSVEAAADKDVLAVLPTGYGKTIVIQALPYLTTEPNCAIVINPLNAIILEQAARFGDSCIVLDAEVRSELKAIQYGKYKDGPVSSKVKDLLNGRINFIIGHPETLLDDIIMRILQTEPLSGKVSSYRFQFQSIQQ
jgi:ATP-dependent DNA helicase RecQ